MKNEDFIKFCKHLSSDRVVMFHPQIIHAIIGIAGEAGELIDTMKKAMVYGQPFDYKNAKEETGDLLHYIARLINECGWTFDDVTNDNVDKLKKRYPNGYSDADALARKDKCPENAPQAS